MEGRNLNELLTIATVSKSFRQKILTNPKAVLVGCEGITVKLSEEDEKILLKHNASSLEELATYILAQTAANLPQTAPKVLIASEYPAITDTISIELNKNHLNAHQTNSTMLLNQHQQADLILLCSTEFPIEICTKLLPLYPRKLALLTDLKKQPIPYYWFGKMAFISLKENISQIVHTVSQIISKKTFYSPLAAIQLLNQTDTTQINLKETELTNREKDVYYLLNLSNNEIARSLKISVSTVRTHVRQINQKIGFNVRKNLVV